MDLKQQRAQGTSNGGVREYGKTAKELVKGQEQLLEKLQDMRFDLSKTEREISRVLGQVKTSRQCMATFLENRGERTYKSERCNDNYMSEFQNTYINSPRYHPVYEDVKYRHLRHIARRYGSNSVSPFYRCNSEPCTPRSQTTSFRTYEDLSPRYYDSPSMYGSDSEYSQEEEQLDDVPLQESFVSQCSFTLASDKVMSDASSVVNSSTGTASTLRDSIHGYMETDDEISDDIDV